MLGVSLLILICKLGNGLSLEQKISGEIGEELKIECTIEGQECLFVSARGNRICTDSENLNCEKHRGIQIKSFGNVCQMIFYPLEEQHYGKWSCQDETWFGTIEIQKTFDISPPLQLSVELTDYFGDVYFRRGDGLNISCIISVDSDQNYKEYPGSPLQWRVGQERVQNNNPYVPRDINEWSQVLNYEPVMKDNHQRLGCFINEDIEDQRDGINLHMIDFEFHSDTIYEEIDESSEENIVVEAAFKSYPSPRKNNVLWKIGDTELHAGESARNGMYSSEIEELDKSEYKVTLTIPPESVEANKLLNEDNYLSVDLVNIRDPFKVPIVFEKAAPIDAAVIPPVISPVDSVVKPTANTTHEQSTDIIQSTVNKLSNSSILGYILGGIITLLFLACCIGYYIWKCCCAQDSNEQKRHIKEEDYKKLSLPLTLNDSATVKENELGYNGISPLINDKNEIKWNESKFSTFLKSEKEDPVDSGNEECTVERNNPAHRPAHYEVQQKIETMDTKDQDSMPFSFHEKSIFYTDVKKSSENIIVDYDAHLSGRDTAGDFSNTGENYDSGFRRFRENSGSPKYQKISETISHSRSSEMENEIMNHRETSSLPRKLVIPRGNIGETPVNRTYSLSRQTSRTDRITYSSFKETPGFPLTQESNDSLNTNHSYYDNVR